jgi:Predicted integral membrane protein (DUF2269)
MDWLALLLKLGHILAAFALVAGLVGRSILLTRASRAPDVEQQHLLAETAAPFERSVQVSSAILVVLGLATAWAQGYPWLGLTTPWILLSVLLLVPMIVVVPAVFIPRGRVFEAEMAAARQAGAVTDELRRAWADPAVAMARRYELVGTALIIALMVLKPF